MSSILTSHGVVVATAMVVSGSFILLALRLQKNLPAAHSLAHTSPIPRSCISSDGKRKERKKKRVHFADDVVEPTGNSEDFRKHRCNYRNTPDIVSNSPSKEQREDMRMPANRAALYRGMLKNRMVHQLVAYPY